MAKIRSSATSASSRPRTRGTASRAKWASAWQPGSPSGSFYPSAEAALAEWRTGVGEIAAAGTELAAVDDPLLVAELLPSEEGILRVGGENVEQLAEYHRGKRLGEVVRQAMPQQERQSDGGLSSADAAGEFAGWLLAGDADGRELPEDLGELVAELVDSWNLNGIDMVFATCSPHRVALCVTRAWLLP
jgi:hypothetical protein